MKYSELIKILKENNFRIKRQAKGSYELWSDGKVVTLVPNHESKEFKKVITQSNYSKYFKKGRHKVMEYIIKNGCYKDGQWIAYLQEDETIFALGKTLKDANENLFSVLNEIVILASTEGTNGLPRQKANQDYIKIVEVTDSYSKEFISKPILSFIDIDVEALTKDLVKSERTNVSIKKIYKNLAKKRGINISEFLNKKLKQELNLNI